MTLLNTEPLTGRTEKKVYGHTVVESLGAMCLTHIGSPKDVLQRMLDQNLRAIEREAGQYMTPKDWEKALVEVRVQVPVEVPTDD